jgi:CBS domain-containing protein
MPQRVMGDIVRDQQPLVLKPETLIRDACQQMCKRRVGAVLVTDNERRLLGIFTGRDAVCRVLAKALDPASATLADAMTKNPATMSPGRPAMEALLLMQDGGFRHIPIVDKGRVVGVVSRGDFRGVEHARLDEETGYAERLW